ncbi:fungal-specific transcription factor domain-containing protein [Aspergillus granulosus]|uniref:Fungal-specific transcription factor domain-containing protein n=1 Tax=Aspergillus granulosus TaxID=176169 RepID=A0ABR4GRW8_9EURO
MINRFEGRLEQMESRLSAIFNVDLGPMPDDICPDNTECSHLQCDDLGFTDIDDTCTDQEPVPAAPISNKAVTTLPDPAPSSPRQETPRHSDIPEGPSADCVTLLSVMGPDWIAEKVRYLKPDSFGASSNSCIGALDPQLLALVAPKRAFCPFPGAGDLNILVHEYMENFNTIFPVFTQDDATTLIAEECMNPLSHSPGQWASIQVILAVAHMLPRSGRSDPHRSSLHLKSALQALNEMMLAPPDLWACKSILVMAFLFMADFAGRQCSFLISTAVHLSNYLDLGKSDPRPTLTFNEIEHRRRLFWLASALDLEASYRFGVPPTHKEDAICEMPPLEPLSGYYSLPSIHEPGVFCVFKSSMELFQIRSQVYRQFYQPSTENRPLHQVLALVGELDCKLQAWRKSIPLEYQPGYQVAPLSRSSSGFPITLISLHYWFYDTMITIHSLLALGESKSTYDLFEGNPFSTAVGLYQHPRVLSSASLTAKAARASLALLRHLPSDQPFLGILSYYPSVAMRTLASSIARSPRNLPEMHNMKLLLQAKSYLDHAALDSSFEAMKRLAKICSDCCTVAQRAMDST